MKAQLTELRRLCATHWNPIGVPMANVTTAEELGYPPLPEDEYAGYLLRLERLAIGGASLQELVSYLVSVEEYIGVSKPAGNREAFVDAVVALLSQR